MAAGQGGDEEAYELVDDLLDRYRSWLRFLHASAATAPLRPRGAVSVITTKPLVSLRPLLDDAVRPRWHRIQDDSATLDSVEVRALVTAAVQRYAEG
jgi:hypothetical protein